MSRISLAIISFNVIQLALTTLGTLSFNVGEALLPFSFMALVLSILIQLLIEKNRVISLFSLYFAGYVLFIGGRYISTLLDWDNYIKLTYCFDFGVAYCLSEVDALKLHLTVCLALLMTYAGYRRRLNQWSVNETGDGGISFRPENLFIKLAVAIGYLAAILFFWDTYQTIRKISESAYLTLYEGQVEAYETPWRLLLTIYVSAITAYTYVRWKSGGNKLRFMIFFSVLILGMAATIMTGARYGFVSALALLVWVYFRGKNINFIRFSIFLLVLMLVPYFINLLLGLTTRSAYEGSVKGFVADLFYTQGITLMVFDLSTKVDGYPIHGYLKTIFPGLQIVVSKIAEIYPFESSFPHYLTYKVSPALYADGYGFGWSLLSDMKVFGVIYPVFFVFSYLWGQLLRRMDGPRSLFMMGVSFCFAVQIFAISRTSLSTLWAMVVAYAMLVYLGRIRFR